ncbi:hypothetical protein [Nocardioides sp.]|uniref:hypothetical protein n=1 Tax=Nocardioides sp. TaxID=35761 RepID=UPI002ED4DF3B
MPKLVNYVARFEFLREAAFTVVHDDGVAALSRHSVARALGTSVNTVRRLLAADAELVVLAADEVARRRSYGRFGRLRDGDPLDRALHVVRALLPDVEHRVAEELVWLRLALPRPRGTAAGAEETPLRERWQIAEHGWADTDPAPGAAPATIGTETADEAGDPLAEHAQRRQEEVDHRIAEALELLAIPMPARKAEAELLGAVTLGLTWAVCGGRLSPGEAVTHLEHHLVMLETRHPRSAPSAS